MKFSDKVKKYKQSCKKARARAKLKRIQQEIVCQIGEITFPDLPPSMLSQINSNENEYFKNGLNGKWIDGSEMTPEKEKYLKQIANELYTKHTTPEQQEQLKRKFGDLNDINNQLFPGPKKIINLDFEEKND